MKTIDWLKRRIRTGAPVHPEKLFREVQEYPFVSFDIFDTLLKRTAGSPADVFSYMEQELPAQYAGFAQKRIIAEQQAREKKKGIEVTLADIYQEYPSISQTDREFLQEWEQNTESSFLQINQDMLPFFLGCLEVGKTVVLISDMYLGRNFIEKILEREGLVGYKKLYLSSEIGLTKREGTLFEFVCQDLKIDRTKLIHIGDSWSSDFQIPKKLGISACHIPTFTPKSHFHLPQSGLSYRILNAFLDNTAPIQADDYYRFGYEKFGMFLNGYVQWLFRSLIQEEISEVWFFSRDGWIMKQAFDRLNEEENGKNEKNGKGKIHSHYLEVSRRSLRIPVLWMDASLSSVLDMVSPSALLPLRTIFDGVGLDIEQYQSLLTQYGFHTETVLDRKTALQNENLNRLYDELLEDILQNSKQEYTYLVKYLQQNQVEGRMAVVDIGWSGGMQRYLEECLTKLQIEHQIKGYYIGVADYYTRNTKVVPTLDLNGYLFDFQDEQRSSDKRRPFVGLFESLFLEQAGSVKNYSEQKGKIVANRMPYEYSENGKESFEAVCVKRIQEGALDFISQASKHPILNTLPFSADDLFSGLQKTGLHPNRKDLSLFADFRFFDEGETEYLAAPKGLFFYFFHLNQLKKDFLLSRWKIGFLKRLLKLPLPYEKIYNVLRGQLGRNGS